MRIRPVTSADAEALRAVYAYYVEKTAVTFEWDVPTEAEFARRIAAISDHYPYLVLEDESGAVGYAYAGTFKDRAAYDWAVETTVYLRQDARGKGYGRALQTALEKELQARHFLNAYACIAWTDQEDEYLTQASPRFHERLGYRLCGTFHRCGYKFGRWYDMIWMEKLLGEHGDQPLPVKWQG